MEFRGKSCENAAFWHLLTIENNADFPVKSHFCCVLTFAIEMRGLVKFLSQKKSRVERIRRAEREGVCFAARDNTFVGVKNRFLLNPHSSLANFGNILVLTCCCAGCFKFLVTFGNLRRVRVEIRAFQKLQGI